MGKFAALVVVVVLAMNSTGCISHNIGTDYSEYLAKASGEGKLPAAKLNATYTLTPSTEKHSYKCRSATTGLANAWIVEFGKILDMQIRSKDVQQAFGKLEKQKGEGKTGTVIVFDLVKYAFADFGAHLNLKISVNKDGAETFTKTYESSGKTQGGKMYWGGAFAMRNAMQQSTKLAIDEILKNFINDVNNLAVEKK